MPVNKIFKEAIFKIKSKYNLNQKEISDKLGIKNTYLSDMINGRVPVTENITNRIYELFQIGEDDGCDRLLTYIYLLPISAYGGSLNNFTVSVKDFNCERILSPIKDVDFAITVAGDSMAPEYPNGSQILIKKINQESFIEWGKVYVLDTCNGAVLKIITKGDREGYLKCTSINQDQKRYAPFEIPMSAIYGIYRVMFIMSIK
jgi:phage repressor protein C with HTH and peptisase S24 domain